MLIIPLAPLTQTIPDPPIGGDWLDILAWLLVVIFALLSPYLKSLVDKKRGNGGGGSLAEAHSSIADLYSKVDKLEKKNKETEARAEAAEKRAEVAEARAEAAEVENRELKKRLCKVEDENNKLKTVIRALSPAINKILNETTSGLNQEALKIYYDLINPNS